VNLSNPVSEDLYRVRSNNWELYTDPVQVGNEEFIEVKCSYPFHLLEMYDYHLQVVKNQKVRKSQFDINFQAIQRVKKYRKTNPSSSQFNVVFILLDSTSHILYQKSMRQTNSVVEKLRSEKRFHHFKFRNYNVVGENSPANQTPLFAGNSEKMLPILNNTR
jgi:hypothetical protein